MKRSRFVREYMCTQVRDEKSWPRSFSGNISCGHSARCPMYYVCLHVYTFIDRDKRKRQNEADYICAGAYDQAKWSKQCGSRYKGKEKRRGETGQRIQCGLQGCLSEVLEDLEEYRLGMLPISSSCRQTICSRIKRFWERVVSKICDRCFEDFSI